MAKKAKFTPEEVLQAARSIERPTTSEIVSQLCDSFLELHGDRRYGDDKAIFGGIGAIDGRPVTIVGTEKGHDTKENLERNFGSPHAEGYRKAIRLFEQAEKFRRPVITFVNTSGAYCDVEAEDRGIGEAIASSMQTLGKMTVPNISIFIGEGGSGGALALAVTNKVWILEDAMYSILSPEGFATILWKDASRKDEAAEIMKYTAQDLHELGVVDEVIPVTWGRRRLASDRVIRDIKKRIVKTLNSYDGMSGSAIRQEREERFRRF